MKAAFHTLGCKVNQYETESMREQFRAAGFETVGEDDFADVYIINTCTVTNIADRKSRQYIRRMKKVNPEAVIAVTGCYAQIEPEAISALPEVDIVAGTGEKNNIVEYVKEFIERKTPQCHIKSYEQLCEYQDRGIICSMESRTRAYIKIQEGCDRFCAYCLIPFARGKVRSRDPGEIVREAEALISRGFKELILTGINTALYGTEESFRELYPEWVSAGAEKALAYPRQVSAGEASRPERALALPEQDGAGRGETDGGGQSSESGGHSEPVTEPCEPVTEPDEPVTGIEIIIKALDSLEGDFRIRLSSLEPAVINAEYVSRLMKYEKLCPHLHLSAQRGSDRVLSLMNRPYTAKEYMDIVKVLRKCDSLYGITTDIIVGFPQETDEDFEDSIKLIEEAEFCKVHGFRYSRRKGTAAAGMDGQVPSEVKNGRAARLMEAGEKASAEFFAKCAGIKRRVLFEERDGAYLTGYTDNYIKVYVPAGGESSNSSAGEENTDCLRGEKILNCFREVKLLERYKDGMKGEI